MDAIRVLHKSHYDPHRNRFISLAFKNTGADPGISIVSAECILWSQRPICGHIRQYYGSLTSDPPIFWRFSTDVLPDHHLLEQEESSTGDVCHYNIKGITDKEARRVFKSVWCDPANFSICDAEQRYRPLTTEDITESMP